MNCKQCNTEMVKLFDKYVNKSELKDVIEHINQCAECNDNYKNAEAVYKTLQPRVLPNAPFMLKHNVINKIKMEELKMKDEVSKKARISSRVKKFLSVAAILAIAMVVVPLLDKDNIFSDSTVKAANSLMESSIKASQFVTSMVVTLKVRTDADDNFDLIDTKCKMVDHTIWKSFSVPAKWKIEKEARVAFCDGKLQYLWMPKLEEALKSDNFNFVSEWIEVLLEPQDILKREQRATVLEGSKYTLEEKNGEIFMNVTSKAQGNFINDYCKNSSIDESDNRREYTFDGNTKLLKALKIYILEGKKETLIMEIEKIDYNVNIDPSVFAVNLPKGVEWKDFNKNYKSNTFANITSKRAAELFFNGLANEDWALVSETCDIFEGNSEKKEKLRNEMGGLKVIAIGEPFKSGLYPGEFVPYHIQLKSGRVKKMNLAVRNDNSNNVWIFDGGL